jgi:hypothetical protein
MLRSALTAFALLALTAIPSQADSITFDLNCVLGHPSAGSIQCGVPTTYGTVTLSDSPGDGDILLTVGLAGSGEKFKDLFFNYNGSAAGITAGAGPSNLLDPNDISHGPYSGKFDVGALDGDDPFSITLYGWNSGSSNLGNASTSGANNVSLLLQNFQVYDTLNQTYLRSTFRIWGPKAAAPPGRCASQARTDPGR